MVSGLRHRVASILGTVALTAGAVVTVNTPPAQTLLLSLPVIGNLQPITLTGATLSGALLTTVAAVVVAMWPVFKPRPRRILDTMEVTARRLFLAVLLLATVGYFDYSYQLPRPTLIGTALVLALWLPVYQVAIRTRPRSTNRAVIVGDDPDAMAAIIQATELPILGYVSPPSRYDVEQRSRASPPEVTDGGTQRRLDELTNLGGLSRLDEVLVEYDIDTALLAFANTGRGEFFGTLDCCYRHGVAALVHREHADTVLTATSAGSDLIEVDLDPWDPQDYLLKRGFDIGFATVGLVVMAPAMAVIVAAIKLDSDGPILYSQERTAEFGETFSVYKFRTMVPNSEDRRPEDDAGNDKITSTGRVLRRTHLDEIPQLWSILRGDMSVVGPRATWTDEEHIIEGKTNGWRKRWFVKPGLTGLAQINDATSTDPAEKLRYDIEYIRKQSFWFDLKIVTRQVWQVFGELVGSNRR